jgi:RecB family exonuclease
MEIFFLIVVAMAIIRWLLLRDSPSDSTQPWQQPQFPSLPPEGTLHPRPNQRPATSRPAPTVVRTGSARKFGPQEVFRKQYVSYTRIKTFKTCPRMFELLYLYGFKDHGGRAAQVGNLVHKIVELFARDHQDSFLRQLNRRGVASELLGYYDRAVSSVDLTHVISSAELRPYLERFVNLNRDGTGRVESIEHKFDAKVGVYDLKGIVDRIDAGNGQGSRLIDYKTGKPTQARNQQLNTYAYALSGGNWKPFDLQYQFLATGEVREWRYTPGQHEKTEEWLLGKIREIEASGEFKRAKSRLCDFCGVSQQCGRVP